MNKYYIIIPITIICVSILIYLISNLLSDLKKAKLGLEKYGTLGINNCAYQNEIDNDDTCHELAQMNITFDFSSKENYSQNNILYIIKLIANFLKYLNSDYNNNKLNINYLINQKLIKSNIDINPVGISYSTQDKTKVFFIFRGTQTASDLTGDTKYNYYDVANPDFNDDIKIHNFFNSIYQETKQQLLDCIYSNTTDIYICGHSMGAAVGFVMAQDLSQNKQYNVHVIGIAPPRTGNSKFVESLKANCKYVLAVINMSDVVPTIPYSYMPNLNEPYTPVQFLQITPAVIFNKLSVSLNANHLIITYYQGIKSTPLSYLL